MTEESLIEQAQKAAQRLEDANKVNEALVKRQEALFARQILGGQSEAGAARPPEVSKEDKDKMDMKNYFKGTAIEQALK